MIAYDRTPRPQASRFSEEEWGVLRRWLREGDPQPVVPQGTGAGIAIALFVGILVGLWLGLAAVGSPV